MRSARRILAFGVVLGFLAAPLASVAVPSGGCCAQQAAPCAPVPGGPGGSCTSLARRSCCESAPVAPSPGGEAARSGCLLHAGSSPPSPTAHQPVACRSAAEAAELSARASPLRLSVVLRF